MKSLNKLCTELLALELRSTDEPRKHTLSLSDSPETGGGEGDTRLTATCREEEGVNMVMEKKRERNREGKERKRKKKEERKEKEVRAFLPFLKFKPCH